MSNGRGETKQRRRFGRDHAKRGPMPAVVFAFWALVFIPTPASGQQHAGMIQQGTYETGWGESGWAEPGWTDDRLDPSLRRPRRPGGRAVRIGIAAGRGFRHLALVCQFGPH